MLTLSIHISYVDDYEVNEILVPMLIFFLSVGGIYNIMEIILEKLDYIKDGWNLADISANALATAYLLMYRYNFDPEDRQTILAFANFVCWVRVIGYFRIFEPTRYLIRMI